MCVCVCVRVCVNMCVFEYLVYISTVCKGAVEKSFPATLYTHSHNHSHIYRQAAGRI